MAKELIYSLRNVGLCYQRSAVVPWKKNAKFWALNDVNMDIYSGETVGIIGKNGAGKSTLLRLLAGITKPDRGQIHKRKGITATLLTLGAGFEIRLTGRQNAELSGMLLGMSRADMRSRMDAIIELAELGEFIDEPVYTYSAGMRARLGFAVAYNIDTDVILLDELLAPGDQAFREKASKLIKEKIKSDYTVIMVMHSMPIIRELCDRVIQIEHGVSLPEVSVEQSINNYLRGAGSSENKEPPLHVV